MGKFKIYFICFLMILAIGCGGGSGGSSGGGGDSDDDDSDDSDSTTTTSIPAAAYALFLPKSEVSTSSDPGGGSVSWESGVVYTLRYIPSLAEYWSFDEAMYESFGCKSSVYPITTTGTNLYRARLCPDYDDSTATVDIKEIDADTGSSTTVCSNINQSGSSGHPAVVGDAIFYRNTSSNLVTQAIPCAGESTLLASGASDNNGELFGVGDSLISIYNDTVANARYVIRKHSTTTGNITETLFNVDEDAVAGVGGFYAGDDAIYGVDYNDSTLAFSVTRYPLTGSSATILSITLPYELQNGVAGVMVDSNNGHVFIACYVITARDGSGYATSFDAYFYDYNLNSDVATELDLDSFFFSQKMQYMLKS